MKLLFSKLFLISHHPSYHRDTFANFHETGVTGQGWPHPTKGISLWFISLITDLSIPSGGTGIKGIKEACNPIGQEHIDL